MNRKLMNWIFYSCIGIIIFGTIFLTTIMVSASGTTIEQPTFPVATISEAYIPSETFSIKEEEVIKLEVVEKERVKPTTVKEVNEVLENILNRKTEALNVLNGLTALGYEEDHAVIKFILEEINNINIDIEYYKAIESEITQKWEQRTNEYPIATQVWLYMKEEFGWNDIVCAGIMGNMMAECGGCWTEDLDWDVDTKHGLGMIQWIGSRKKLLVQTYGSQPTVEEQLLFMKDELYGTNGVEQQVSESELNEIMNASTPEDCAFAFASYFERCAKKHRSPRRGYAAKAYEYFVD